ncbi:uncharacterized protein LOC135348234 isoform X2 [Halichondria panicea]|uniref:uncharacterized protein LOC135348234 isoform X2 n=1 Tax=Halichondria panicea TaxID=6063 RepID=UPI00312B5191
MAGDGHAHLLSNIMDQRTPLLGLEGGGRPSAAADGPQSIMNKKTLVGNGRPSAPPAAAAGPQSIMNKKTLVGSGRPSAPPAVGGAPSAPPPPYPGRGGYGGVVSEQRFAPPYGVANQIGVKPPNYTALNFFTVLFCSCCGGFLCGLNGLLMGEQCR